MSGFLDEVVGFFTGEPSDEEKFQNEMRERQKAIDAENRRQTITGMVKADKEVIRAEEDLEVAETNLGRAKQQFEAARQQGLDKQNAAYDKELNAAQTALERAQHEHDTYRDLKFDHAKPAESEQKLAHFRTKLDQAQQKKSAIANKDAWRSTHPLEQFMPPHFQQEVAACEASVKDMHARHGAAWNAAWARAEATLQQNPNLVDPSRGPMLL